MQFNRLNISKEVSRSNLVTSLLIILISIITICLDLQVEDSHLSLILFTSILSSTLIATLATRQLKAKKLNQVIRKEGPKKHQEKCGTPTMGGIIIVPIGIIIALMSNHNSDYTNQLLAISSLTVAFMLIGFIDDWKSFSMKQNTGLTPKGKIFLQVMAGVFFLLWIGGQGWLETNVYLFKNHSIDFGLFMWPIALLVLIAESNSTNLTDGLDGLASGCGAIVFIGLGIELMIQGNPGSLELTRFCIAMAGAWLGFLILNKNPARLFMGDTGSLAMGASLAGVALISNTLWSLFLMGIIFFSESVSVIIQVVVYKLTKYINGKGYRVFRMAPLHHHFELNGNKEIQIVQNFWLLTISFVFLALLLRSNYQA